MHSATHFVMTALNFNQHSLFFSYIEWKEKVEQTQQIFIYYNISIPMRSQRTKDE
jgi:hypothetical protein